jgi:hypothetical protein
MQGKALAEGPVLVEQGHADGGIGIEHLLGGDHLDLVGIDVESQLADADGLDGIMNALDRPEIPIRSMEEQAVVLDYAHGTLAPASASRRRKSSRKTG